MGSTNILLSRPKFAHNVGAAVRALSCFGDGEIFFTGDRFDLEGSRLPREERMKAYASTPWTNLGDEIRPIDRILAGADAGMVPVAIELLPSSQGLHHFEHPENALYVFGPEDGSLADGLRRNCHQFVTIPSQHCLNLAAAVYVTLYDRCVKRWTAGLDPMPTLDEERGYWHTSAMEESR